MNRVSPIRVWTTLAAMIVAFVAPVAAVLAVPQAAGAATPIEVTTTSLPGAIVGQPYSAQIQVTGGSGSYIYSLSDVPQYPLPPGLSLGLDTGLISGTPGSPPVNQPTTYTLLLQVSDKNGDGQMASPSLTITLTPPGYVPPPALQMTTTSVPEATSNKAYSFQMQAAGGTPAYSWSTTGLPKGFAMSQSGVISGQTGEPQQTTITVTAVDSGVTYAFYGVTSSAQQTVRQSYTFTISSGNAELDSTIFQLQALLSHSDGLSSSFLAEIVVEIDALINGVVSPVEGLLCEIPEVSLISGLGCGIP